MSPSEAAKKPGAPGWISAACAVLVTVIALVNIAASPAQETLDDHDARIRALETTMYTSITRLESAAEELRKAVNRLREQRMSEQ